MMQTSDPPDNGFRHDSSVPPDATVALRVVDPGILRLQQEFSHDNLEAMQAALGRCEVEHIAQGPALRGFNFIGMVKNLRGMGKVELGSATLYTLLTRNNAFILSNLIAEELHDLVRGLMDLYLGDRIILTDGSKRRFLYKVPSVQLEELRRLANQNRLITASGFPFRDLEQFKKRLAVCTARSAFDIVAFANSIKAVSNMYEDRNGNQYHHIVAGEMEYPYVLYVHPKTPPSGAVELYFGATQLLLVRD